MVRQAQAERNVELVVSSSKAAGLGTQPLVSVDISREKLSHARCYNRKHHPFYRFDSSPNGPKGTTWAVAGDSAFLHQSGRGLPQESKAMERIGSYLTCPGCRLILRGKLNEPKVESACMLMLILQVSPW